MTTAIIGVGSLGRAIARHLVAGDEHASSWPRGRRGTLLDSRMCWGRERSPRPSSKAAGTIERLINAAGFDPMKAGGFAQAGRIEGPGGALPKVA
jgi:predicted dinucleotide-binding enzyme